MKLYVLAVEKECDAKCFFCITKRRKVADKKYLDLSSLEKILANTPNIQKVEITGGGEPTLHPEIDKIIDLCSEKLPTIMYTHGAHLSKLNKLDSLSELCISVAHNDEEINRKIMGVYPDLNAIKSLKVPVKFSLLLNNKGINSKGGVESYLDWASEAGAKKVVIRQLFEENNDLERFFVSTQNLFDQFKSYKESSTAQGNPVINYNGLKVEFEYRSCACEMDNLILHADGKIVKGWNYIDTDRK